MVISSIISSSRLGVQDRGCAEAISLSVGDNTTHKHIYVFGVSAARQTRVRTAHATRARTRAPPVRAPRALHIQRARAACADSVRAHARKGVRYAHGCPRAPCGATREGIYVLVCMASYPYLVHAWAPHLLCTCCTTDDALTT